MAAKRSGDTLKSSNGALFVQVDGPNTRPELVSCADLDEISAPGGGIAELIRCFNEEGDGWDVLDATRTPDDPVTTTITTLLKPAEHLLERAGGCPVPIYAMQRVSGKASEFTNYVRAYTLGVAYLGDKGLQDIVRRDEDAPSMATWAISALPPMVRNFKKVTSRLTQPVVEALNSLHFCNSQKCATSYAPAQRKCKVGVAIADPASSAKPSVIYTTNYGQTWTLMTNLPFANNDVGISITCFEMANGVTRVVAALGTTAAGAPAKIAYTDDFGATAWVTVTVGSTNALFFQSSNSLYSLDQYDIWGVTDSGNIHHSEDAGVTWVNQHAGVLTTQALHAVHFVDDRVGVAVGAAGAVLKTLDGGITWALMTAPGAVVLKTVAVIDAMNFWVGSASGRMYYTQDGGTTWTERSFTGSGSGSVNHIVFTSLFNGYMIHQTTGPVGSMFYTINGGYTWEKITTTANAGLNQLAVCGVNEFYAVGEASGGTGVFLKAMAAP